MLGAESLQSVALDGQRTLEGMGEGGIVHRDHSQPRFQLANLDFGSREFKVNRVLAHWLSPNDGNSAEDAGFSSPDHQV
jgi:hypothetical protein